MTLWQEHEKITYLKSFKEVKYPKQTFLLLIFTLLERFVYYVFAGILFSYLSKVIKYSPETLELILQMFHVVANSFPILGAIVADCWVGKYGTIVFFTLIYICGLLIISITGIFGRYLTIKRILKLRCYGYNTCWSLSFGITTLLVATVFIMFIVGKRYFIITKPETNIFVHWTNCVGHAVKQKIKSSEHVENWLDRSVEKYGKKFVHHVKTNFRILPVYVPLIFYSTLELIKEHITRIQGDFVITKTKPTKGFSQEIHNMRNILFAIQLLLIPLFVGVIYPVCARCNLLTTPLQRIGCGIMFSGISFFVAGFLSLAIESNIASLPSMSECHLRIYNPLNCTIRVNAPPYVDNVEIASMGKRFIKVPDLEEIKVVDYEITGCENLISNMSGDDFVVIQGKSISYFVSTRGFMHFLDNIPDYSYALPKIRILVGNPDERPKKWNLTRQVPVVHSKSPDYSLYNVRPGPHVLEDMKTVINAARGEIYTILKFLQNGSLKKNEVYEITQRNKPNALWQLPQDIFFFIGQIMVHPNSFEFAYTQAPIHMKTLMTTFFLWLATFFGSRLNDIFVLMPEFDNQSDAFFICSGFMLVIMSGFVFFAKRYKYVEDYNDENIQDNEEITLK
ncbi:peptide transporter family 1-like isoform X4 [Tenebrio molitor]|uniref:peptide transporter family 1-like isoform X4 n=1 Tax=Tenebrio molitor TaxID=7067 RepID=UPI003624ABB7